MTKVNTHATAATYIMCVVLGILSVLILWWIPLVLDSVSCLFTALTVTRLFA
ncbi:hypothetical protein ACHAWF_015691 [Thalassiosira exigua]